MPTARSRPEAATTVGWPRRSGAASRMSSWTRVAMWTSSTAAAARTAAGAAVGPGAEQDEQRPQPLPPAASVAPAAASSSSPWPASLLAQQLLDLAEAGRQPAARGVEDRGDRRRDGRAAGHPAMPVWIVTMPPARIVYRIPSRPAARSILSARPRGAGEGADRLGQVGVGLGVVGDAAEDRRDAVEPERVEGREGRPLRPGELEHDEAAAGPQHPRHLAQAAVAVGEVADAEADRDRVEAAGVVGQAERVGPLEADAVGAPAPGLVAGEVEHRLGEVAADHVAAGRDAARRARG